MPIFTLSVDVDDKELIDAFYGNSEDAWGVRESLHKSMVEIMKEYLATFSGIPKENTFRCSAFESVPDNSNHKKVGLRFLYSFTHLAFSNTRVVAKFLRGFEYFVFKREKTFGCSIDSGVYPTNSCHQLRITYSASALYVPEGELLTDSFEDPLEMSRPLLPWWTDRSLSLMNPSHSLVHKKHPYFCDDAAVVMTQLGDIQDLVTKYSPTDAEFNLLRRRSGRRANRLCRKRKIDDVDGHEEEEEEDVALVTSDHRVTETLLGTSVGFSSR
ncbi:hypothetical protein ElyMa_004523700 [Elysia marginata]|uniref:Uncharacterized protein n=1 Tax=Elysia marginata TaxID=1093978 RepID=A0AAV4HMA0_9GAST|nr:hypothetical protein ElyMa_004523700 [Elysia marginata]